MKREEIIKEFLREIGAKGGRAATGKKKVRGDSAYYSKLRKMGTRKQRKES